MKNKRKNIKMYKSLQPPINLGASESCAHCPKMCIYRLFNVRPHFINCVVDSQNSSPNWSLCRDIKRFVVIALSVFVTVSVVASCILSRPILWACSWIVSQHTLIMSRHNLYSAVLFLLRQECLVSRHQTCLHSASHVLVLLEFVAT